MHHAGVVGRLEGVCQLGADLQQSLDRQGPVRDEVLQGLALHPLHHQERTTVVLSDVVKDAEVRVIEGRGRPGLALESLQRLGSRRRLFGQELQRHVPPEARVFRLVHDPHPAATQLRQDAVVRDRFADHVTYSMPSRFWMSSRGMPFVSGMTRSTQTSCRTIITA